MNPIDKFCAITVWLFSILMILLALFFTIPCKAEPWSKEQKQLAGIATTLHIIDWAQTRHIARNPHKFSELNPILPNHPSLAQVNTHFIWTGIATGLLAHNFPKYRSLLLKTYIGYQTINTVRNYHIGIKMEF